MGKIKPRYLVICQDIREKIQEGTYAINDKLPDGQTLASQYGVSLLTLKRALDLLVAEGFIIRRRGDGTLVRDWKSKGVSRLYSLKGTYHDYREHVTSKILKFEVIHPSAQVASKLCVNQDSFVYEIQRLRILDDRPIIMEYSYMPVDVIPGLSTKHLEQSIYGYIQDELGYKIHSAFVKVAGVRPNAIEQLEMNLSDTDFLMETERVSSLGNCKTFEYSIARHLPDVFHFETVIFHH
nr:GntR family transcriptional regulator [Streptococcus ruminantium]